MPIIPLEKGVRKEDVFHEHLKQFEATESVVMIGKSQWLTRLPHPFTPRDRRAGFAYQLSILQAEFALTQVLDRPLCGVQPRVTLTE